MTIVCFHDMAPGLSTQVAAHFPAQRALDDCHARDERVAADPCGAPPEEAMALSAGAAPAELLVAHWRRAARTAAYP